MVKIIVSLLLCLLGASAFAQAPGNDAECVARLRQTAGSVWDKYRGCYVLPEDLSRSGGYENVPAPGSTLEDQYRRSNSVFGSGHAQHGISRERVVTIRQPQQMPSGNCQLVEKKFFDRLIDGGAEAILNGISGYFAGRAIDYYRARGDERWERISVNGAVGYGFWQGSASNQVLACQDPQVIRQQIAQQPLQQQGRLSGGETIVRPARCVVGDDDFGDTSQETCLKIRRKLTTSAPAETRTAENQKAYCSIYRVKNGQKEVKKVENPTKETAFCDELPTLLQSGEKLWEEL